MDLTCFPSEIDSLFNPGNKVTHRGRRLVPVTIARSTEELNYSPMDGMRQSIDSDVVGSNPSEKSNFSLRASSSGETH